MTSCPTNGFNVPTNTVILPILPSVFNTVILPILPSDLIQLYYQYYPVF